MSELTPDQLHFEALAATYAAGGLNATDKAWMDAYLKAHPESQTALRWHVGMVQHMHARFDDVPANIGLDKALSQIQAFPKFNAVSPWTRLLRWLFGGVPRLTPVFVTLLATTVASTLVLIQSQSIQLAETRSVKKGLLDGPLLRVNFKTDVREGDLRALLLEQGALVVGPTRLGDWFIHVAPQRMSTVQDALAKSNLVSSVDIVQALPAELVDQ